MSKSSSVSSMPSSSAIFTPAAAWVCTTLEEAGYVAYAVGGCVRDLLMGKTPKDIDVVTNALPEQVQAVFPEAFLTGNHFLVSRVRYELEEIEIATFRKDIYPPEGSSKPDSVVKVDTLEEDLLRRDYTLNAIAVDLRGQLHDPLDGIKDIQNNLLRETHSLACREDPIRILRGCKLVSRYGLLVETGTFEHMKEFAAGLKNVAAERIAKELLDTLAAPFADAALLLWRDLAILPLILPSTADVAIEKWDLAAACMKLLPANPCSFRLAILARLTPNPSELYSAFGVPKREWKKILFLTDYMELSFSPDDPESVRSWLNGLNMSGWQEFLPLLEMLAILAGTNADLMDQAAGTVKEHRSRVEDKLKSIRDLAPDYPLGVRDLPFSGSELTRRRLKGEKIGSGLREAVQWMRTFGDNRWGEFWERIEKGSSSD